MMNQVGLLSTVSLEGGWETEAFSLVVVVVGREGRGVDFLT